LILLKLRKEKRIRSIEIFLCGVMEKYNLNDNNIGLNINCLIKFIEGKHVAATSLKKSKNPIIIIGSGILSSLNCKSMIELFLNYKYCNKNIFNTINFLELGSGLINIYEVGIFNKVNKVRNSKVLNFNVTNLLQIKEFKSNIFFGTHGDYFLNKYKIILPINTNIEARNIFINNEGRPQLTKIVQKGPFKSKMDWQIIVGLFDKLYNQDIIDKISFKSLRDNYNIIYNLNLNSVSYINFFKIVKRKYKLYNLVILPYVLNSYAHNVILQNSRILLKAKAFFVKDIYK